MPTLLEMLRKQFSDARSALDASEKTVRDASAARRASIMKLKPALRIKRINDPALVAFDRAEIERSLQDELLARRFISAVSRDRINLIGRQIRYRRVGLVQLAVCLTPLAVLGVIGWQNTAHRAVLAQGYDIEWHYPNGATSVDRLFPETYVNWLRVENGTLIIRNWQNGIGYGYLSLPIEAVYLKKP